MADSARIEELKRRVQLDPASIAFATLAEEYRRAGRYVEAIAVCRAGLQRHPSYISAHVTLGRALLEIGEFEEAGEELELVLRIAPENLAAIRGLAEIHHRRGEATESQDFVDAGATEPQAAVGEAPAPSLAETPEVALAPATTGAADVPPSPDPEHLHAEPRDRDVLRHVEPSEDRALAGLEEFLEAIIRVRKGAGGIHVA